MTEAAQASASTGRGTSEQAAPGAAALRAMAYPGAFLQPDVITQELKSQSRLPRTVPGELLVKFKASATPSRSPAR
jgi:hypothetical protein